MEGSKGGDPPDPGAEASTTTGPQLVLYSNEHRFSWYKVIVQAKPGSVSNSQDTTRKPFLRALAVSKVLGDVTNYSKDITEVRRLTRTKFLIICSTAGCANKIVQSEKVKSLYHAFIPQVYLTRTAIMRDVDVEVDGEMITEEEIFNNIDCGQFKLIKVQRLNRKVMNDDSKPTFVPSTSVKLVFDGQDMPSHVYLWYTRLPCEPFIQNPTQCFTCFKFGHVSKFCSTKSSLCRKCFQVEAENHVCDLVNLKCLNCHGPHNVNSKNCPEFDRQKNIKVLMSTRNMCFPEAADLVPSSKRSYAIQTKNPFDALNDVSADFSDFPELKRKNPHGRREFTKYIPPALPQSVKRKPTFNQSSAPISSNQAAKKNRTDTGFLDKMRNLTKPQKFYSDKEISGMFYANAKTNKIDSTSANVLPSDVPTQGSQGITLSATPNLQTKRNEIVVNNNSPVISCNNHNNDDVHMSENMTYNNSHNNQMLPGSYPNVNSPDLS